VTRVLLALGLAVDAQNVFHAASMDAPEYGIKWVHINK
jgi:hypothetical protein